MKITPFNPQKELTEEASIGVITVNVEDESEFIPLAWDNLSLGTMIPTATDEAGDWNAFIKPVTVLAINMCRICRHPDVNRRTMAKEHKKAMLSDQSMMFFFLCLSTKEPANTLIST